MRFRDHLETVRDLLLDHSKELREALKALPEDFDGKSLPREVEDTLSSLAVPEGKNDRRGVFHGRYIISDRGRAPSSKTPSDILAAYKKPNPVLDRYKTPLGVDGGANVIKDDRGA